MTSKFKSIETKYMESREAALHPTTGELWEVEHGTHRFAWTQGVGRTRWALVKFGLVVAVTLALAIGYGLGMAWWVSPLTQAAHEGRPEAGQLTARVAPAKPTTRATSVAARPRRAVRPPVRASFGRSTAAPRPNKAAVSARSCSHFATSST